nr:MAG TPA: hypothetical protein [Caudoviricetes sp.]
MGSRSIVLVIFLPFFIPFLYSGLIPLFTCSLFLCSVT